MTTPYDAAYREDGFITRIGAFTGAEIAGFRAKFDELERELGKEKAQIGIQAEHFAREFIWELATGPRVLETMRRIMGEDILLLSTHFFCKYPDRGAGAFVAWHQDVTYWGLEPPIAHTAWIAIDSSDIDNGCMRVIPGSHKGGILTHGTSKREGNLLSVNQEIPAELLRTELAVDLELEAGQMSVHHGMTVHASNPNRSSRRRCGLTVRFIPTEVGPAAALAERHKWRPVLVSGRDTFGRFPKSPPPFSFR